LETFEKNEKIETQQPAFPKRFGIFKIAQNR